MWAYLQPAAARFSLGGSNLAKRLTKHPKGTSNDYVKGAHIVATLLLLILLNYI
jgi:hypothetical protein